jgi:DNA-binding transcriptional ArsR family regulator
MSDGGETLLADVASVVGEPTRARMLTVLLDGRSHTAKELAICAGVRPSTASAHLGLLTREGFVALQRSGRCSYYHLASAAVAETLERIAGLAVTSSEPRVSRIDPALRRARMCYDHLAGELGVRICSDLVRAKCVLLDADGGEVTPAGEAMLASLGIDPAALRRGRRTFLRPCLDWTERRPHLGGALGAALARVFLDRGWVRRVPDGRALEVVSLAKPSCAERGEAGVLEYLAVSRHDAPEVPPRDPLE